jgi:hypothetical protein
MECPKCGLPQDISHAECPRCGIVFAKVLRARKDAALAIDHGRSSVQADVERTHAERQALRGELRARVLALPCALLGAGYRRNRVLTVRVPSSRDSTHC